MAKKNDNNQAKDNSKNDKPKVVNNNNSKGSVVGIQAPHVDGESVVIVNGKRVR